MNRKHLLLTAVLLCLSLAACSGSPAVPTTTMPTTIPFPVELTPNEMLASAVEKTCAASSYTLSYGLCTGGKNDRYEETFRRTFITLPGGGFASLSAQSCGCGLYARGNFAAFYDCETQTATAHTADSPLTRDYLTADRPAIVTNPNFLADFCNKGMIANITPDGMSFTVSELSRSALYKLVTGQEHPDPAADDADFYGFVTLQTNSSGYLTRIEVSRDDGQGYYRLTLQNFGGKLTVTAPDWAVNPS